MLSLGWWKSGWIPHTTYGMCLANIPARTRQILRPRSFDPAAEKTCEDLLNLALQTDPGNTEALQAFASVRMSQQRPDDAKAFLEQAWSQWQDLDLGVLPCYPPQYFTR